LFLPLLADAPSVIHFDQLGLSPIILEIGWFKLRWYSVSYIAAILLGWWYLVKLLGQAGAPMARRHADDFIAYATLGIILGGRLGFCLFYRPEIFLDPIQIVKLWEGGMSLHGGVVGVLIAIWLFVRKHKISFLRMCDYIACCTPFGLILVRLANFVNGELWGRPTDLPWAMIFPGAGDGLARHPSQLYEAGLEGVVSLVVMWFLFWKTDARYHPGKLFGVLAIIYGAARFIIEFVREPDNGITGLFGLTMGQTLCIPMLLGGIWLVKTSKARRARVEPVVGTESVA
jgi:phosphatidylglycerol---prolipoprotein diacylglyceryl transferase